MKTFEMVKDMYGTVWIRFVDEKETLALALDPYAPDSSWYSLIKGEKADGYSENVTEDQIEMLKNVVSKWKDE